MLEGRYSHPSHRYTRCEMWARLNLNLPGAYLLWMPSRVQLLLIIEHLAWVMAPLSLYFIRDRRLGPAYTITTQDPERSAPPCTYLWRRPSVGLLNYAECHCDVLSRYHSYATEDSHRNRLLMNATLWALLMEVCSEFCVRTLDVWIPVR